MQQGCQTRNQKNKHQKNKHQKNKHLPFDPPREEEGWGAADAGEWSSCRGVVMEFERIAGESLTEAWGLFCGKWMGGAAVPRVILGGLGNVGKCWKAVLDTLVGRS